VFDYFDGAAEDERTLAGNRAAFARARLLPRTMVDVSRVDASIDLLGARAGWPLVIAPIGGPGIGRPGADLAMARAAARHGVPYTLSTMATVTLEELARAVDGRRWFQLYVLKDRAYTDALVARAAAHGYEALVVTVDLPVGGKRERDLRNRFAQPFRPTARHVLEALGKPAWALGVLRHGLPDLANLRGYTRDAGETRSTLASSVGRELDPSLDEARIAELRARWPGRFVVKGILHPGDALRAIELGADAIWVSNHGGRQLDGAIASLDALPAIAAAVAGRVPILLDGGVCRGVDVAVALARGASAVALGRATLYGALAGGEPGALRALEILGDELERTMRLLGARRREELSGAILAPCVAARLDRGGEHR
jgi:(S)-mandelate dehydrogenase